MNEIHYPNFLNNKYYKSTIQSNPNITNDGFYYGPKNKAYQQSRIELSKNYKLIYMCDYWLDGHYFHDYYSFLHVPDTDVLWLIEKYYNEFYIPPGCLAIAVKHRDEMHLMAPDGLGFDLLFNEKAHRKYKELYIKH